MPTHYPQTRSQSRPSSKSSKAAPHRASWAIRRQRDKPTSKRCSPARSRVRARIALLINRTPSSAFSPDGRTIQGGCGVVLEGSATNGAAPPLPASHPQACAAAVDELVGQIRAANIAINMPSPINDDTPSIVLKLDLHKSKSTFAAEISAEGRKETDTIQVSETMTTHLKSDDLK